MKEKSKMCFGICGKIFMLYCFSFISVSNVNAQKGLFAKFSIGPGYTTEYSNINSNGFSVVTKNHAIGWGITDKFAIQIGEFGGLNKQKFGDYNYINLDAFGLGFSYRTPVDIKITVLGAYSMVSFAKKWSQSFGDDGGNGFGLNMSIDKEWFVAKRWGIRLGPQFYWLKTINTDYKFFNVSINGSLIFYLTPVR
ncbi:MAG: hypothetical protein MUC93_08500 [Bacteroidales bacterium]|nr:hypothetical protein [Bacteroidales bacterium]